jgi:hypothetical protein
MTAPKPPKPPPPAPCRVCTGILLAANDGVTIQTKLATAIHFKTFERIDMTSPRLLSQNGHGGV